MGGTSNSVSIYSPLIYENIPFAVNSLPINANLRTDLLMKFTVWLHIKYWDSQWIQFERFCWTPIHIADDDNYFLFDGDY